MAETVRTWSVPGLGTGKPDYSGEIWKGAVYDRIVLEHNEAVIGLGLLLTDSPLLAPHARAPLASGATIHVIDMLTGVPAPYLVPAGYTRSVLSYWWSFNQPVEGKDFRDGVHFTSLYENAYVSHYEHDIDLDYYGLDPTGLLPHTYDYTLTNLGSRDMKGFYLFLGKVRAVGTPRYPERKTVRCVHCQHKHEVSRKATLVKCPKCGETTTYWPLLFGKEEPEVIR